MDYCIHIVLLCDDVSVAEDTVTDKKTSQIGIRHQEGFLFLSHVWAEDNLQKIWNVKDHMHDKTVKESLENLYAANKYMQEKECISAASADTRNPNWYWGKDANNDLLPYKERQSIFLHHLQHFILELNRMNPTAVCIDENLASKRHVNIKRIIAQRIIPQPLYAPTFPHINYWMTKQGPMTSFHDKIKGVMLIQRPEDAIYVSGMQFYLGSFTLGQSWMSFAHYLETWKESNVKAAAAQAQAQALAATSATDKPRNRLYTLNTCVAEQKKSTF
jgi:hypothetical protein